MNLKLLHISLLGVLLLLFAGCKHVEKVVIERKLKPVSVRRAVRLVRENEVKFNTLSVKKVRLNINNDGNTFSIRGLYRIKKDSIIQVKAQKLTVPVGNLEIDQDSFRVVKHIGSAVISGTIQSINDLAGTDVDYQTIQSILSNHIQSIKQDQIDNPFKDYTMAIEENMYKISSIRERKFKKFSNNENRFERFKQRNEEEHLVKHNIYIDPDIFVVRKIVFNDLNTKMSVTIEFSEFKELGTKWFPGTIHLSVSGKKKLEVQIELSKISIDDETDFGFVIPSKYKREEFQKY
ncbi:MAG TPA: DUF4292 domain-containing protein [Prolixibacteraceae bacterium]